MTEQQILDETIRYIDDNSYNYAVLIDGDWGCGKTYLIQNTLVPKITTHEKQNEQSRIIKYISLYGCRSISDIYEKITWCFLEDAQVDLFHKKGWKKADNIAQNVIM